MDLIKNIKKWQLFLVFLTVALIVFFIGLRNPYLGDDLGQIVNNKTIQSASNIKLLFEGSTFYNGEESVPLSGIYYRPLMMVMYTLLYVTFGASTLSYHLLQVLLCAGSAFFLYLLFSKFLGRKLSFGLAILFLVHPLNSQIGFYIANLQDALMFFFGITGLYITTRYKSLRMMGLALICMLGALLSKESGGLFILLAMLYLLLWDRKRLLIFTPLSLIPAGIWFWLKLKAVGFSQGTHIAPIADLSLLDRLLNVPHILMFYFSKFLLPYPLASGYYWADSSITMRGFFMPLLFVLVILAILVLIGIKTKARNKKYFKAYIFFAIWTCIAIIPYLQILPLTMTVSDSWFYTASAGLIGMLGVGAQALIKVKKPEYKVAIRTLAILVICVLSLTTVLRGRDYRDPVTLAHKDIKAKSESYNAYNTLASDFTDKREFSEAKFYVLKSLELHPSHNNYNNLGLILINQGDPEGAWKAYSDGLKYGETAILYENMAVLTMFRGSYDDNMAFFKQALNRYPKDGVVWFYLSVLQQRQGDNAEAKKSMQVAGIYNGIVYPAVYNGVIYNTTTSVQFPDRLLTIPAVKP